MEIDEKVFEELAKRYRVTADEIKRNISEAISEAYQDPNSLAKTVPRKNDVPTIDELSAFVIQNIKNEKEK